MKYAGLLLAFFLCFTAVDGFCGGKKDKSPKPATNDVDTSQFEADLKKANDRADQLQKRLDQMANASSAPAPMAVAPIPITREILNQVSEYRQDLNRLYYYLSMTLVLTINKNKTDAVTSDDGRLRFTEKNAQKPIRISSKVAGRKETDPAQDMLGKDRRSFEIAFSDENDADTKYYLKFVRNDKDNCFDLETVETDGIIYGFSFDGLKPHLCVYYEYASDDDSRIEVQGRVRGASEVKRTPPPVDVIPEVSESFDDPTMEIEIDSASARAPQEQTEQAADFSADPAATATTPRTSRDLSALGEMLIIGEGSLKVDPVAEFIWMKNRNMRVADIKEVIRIYIEESQQEGVNADLAIAQMCHITDYLRSVNFYNYAGFSTEEVGAVQFSSPRDGVIAHVQHLKGYASADRPREPILDPRYEILNKRGLTNTAKTFDDLLTKWAPRSGYSNDVKDKLKLLYQVSDGQI